MLATGSATRRRFAASFLALAACCSGAPSCNFNSNGEVRLHLQEPFPKRLSDWHLFTETDGGLKPNDGVLPYDLNTPLFSDYASKYRFVWMPVGTSAEYREETSFEFPLGTILSKSFAFPVDGHPGEERLIETRLLVRTSSGWIPLPYVWDDSQKDATLQIVPDPVPIHYTDASGRTRDFTYQIPNTNNCRECHDHNRSLQPIGPKARNLNMDYDYVDGAANQLARWTEVGYLRGAPLPPAAPREARWNEPRTGSLDERARAYLDNNCAHCHQAGGSAGYTGVDFRLGHSDLTRFGVCKHPNSAGNMGDRRYDLVPGDPERSILVYRLESTAPKVMMPQIGRAVVHTESIALLREWVAALQGDSCATVSANAEMDR